MNANDRHVTEYQHSLDDEYVRLLNLYKKPLFRLILCMVRHNSDAEDLFQQTAITMWDKFRDFEPGTDFLAWASSIARNKFRDFVKMKARGKVFLSDSVIDKLAQKNDDSALDGVRMRALVECRKKLGQRDQELLAACYGRERSVVELAGQTGRSAGSIYNSLWRIRRALYACIERTLAREGVS